MVFTNLGRVVAFILLLSGIFHIAMIAAGWLTPEQAALAVFFHAEQQQVRLSTGAYMRSSLASHLVF
jgi:hypothetical protein